MINRRHVRAAGVTMAAILLAVTASSDRSSQGTVGVPPDERT
jgi:hypothetical protein